MKQTKGYTIVLHLFCLSVYDRLQPPVIHLTNHPYCSQQPANRPNHQQPFNRPTERPAHSNNP